jgi:hypothetical protein
MPCNQAVSNQIITIYQTQQPNILTSIRVFELSPCWLFQQDFIIDLLYSAWSWVDSAVEWRRGTAVPSHVPRPNHAGRKKQSYFIFFGASPLNAQWSPDVGHENGIILSHSHDQNQVTVERWGVWLSKKKSLFFSACVIGTSSEPSGQERDCSPIPCPPPQSCRQKKIKMFFFESQTPQRSTVTWFWSQEWDNMWCITPCWSGFKQRKFGGDPGCCRCVHVTVIMEQHPILICRFTWRNRRLPSPTRINLEEP